MLDLGKTIVPPFRLEPRLVLINPEFQGWFDRFYELLVVLMNLVLKFFLFVGLPATIAGGVLAVLKPAVPAAVLVLTLVLCASCWFFVKHSLLGDVLDYWQRQRAEAEICERGIRVTFARGRVVEIPLAEVAAFEGWKEDISPNGRFWGESCKIRLYKEVAGCLRSVLTLWGDWPGRLEPEHPMTLAWQCCQDAAKAHVRARLQAGQVVKGRGWRLTADALHRGRKTIPLANLAAVELQKGRLYIWLQSIDEPVLKFPWRGPNAPVLLSVLQDHVSSRTPAQDEPGLGRLIVKKWWLGWDGAFVLIGTVFFGLLLLILLDNSRIGKAWLIAFTVGLVLAAGLIVYRLAIRQFRVHARGIAKKGILWTQVLKDHEIAGLRCNTERYYIKGVYRGLLYDITAIPDPATRKRRIHFRALFSSLSEQELDRFRNRVSRLLAARMIELLHKGGECEWCPRQVLTLTGIRFRPKKVFGWGEEVFILYTDIVRLDLYQGYCKVIVRSTQTPAAVLSQNDHNFWPGYFSVWSLVQAGERGWCNLEQKESGSGGG